ncbi:hypothetical protein CDAR_176981 [Caerostris darwini]|uniref:LAGLIDADG homing endonuclease n=1 Tax=Caerostris darwini TaxID=1538125 RepID=A0AAV4UBE9_9ARAC|nr:hypothetical protein CDAR_176981 [Caerostris darwini]
MNKVINYGSNVVCRVTDGQIRVRERTPGCKFVRLAVAINKKFWVVEGQAKEGNVFPLLNRFDERLSSDFKHEGKLREAFFSANIKRNYISFKPFSVLNYDHQ